MSNVKKPEPELSQFRLKTQHGEWLPYWWDLSLSKYVGGEKQERHFITTDQAEAYKDACVREALEQAEEAVVTLYESADLPYLPDITRAIRALIPKQ